MYLTPLSYALETVKVVNFTLSILLFKKYTELIKTGLSLINLRYWVRKTKFKLKQSGAFLLFQKLIQTLLVIFVEKNWYTIGNRQIHYSDQFDTIEEPNILGATNVLLEKYKGNIITKFDRKKKKDT